MAKMHTIYHLHKFLKISYSINLSSPKDGARGRLLKNYKSRTNKFIKALITLYNLIYFMNITIIYNTIRRKRVKSTLIQST